MGLFITQISITTAVSMFEWNGMFVTIFAWFHILHTSLYRSTESSLFTFSFTTSFVFAFFGHKSKI